MRILLALPVILPVLGAALTLAATRFATLQRVIAFAALAGSFAAGVVLLVAARSDGPVATQVGGWPAPYGITLVVDTFSALLVVVSTAVQLLVLVYALGQGGATEVRRVFYPVYLLLSTGVSGAFVAGDLFNLFVAFEVMLTASYVMLVLGAGEAQVRAAMTYVVCSLVSSLLFLTAVALAYAATGTVNLADLAARLADVPPGLRTTLGLLLLVAFGIKAAVFPLAFWLPDAYPTAPGPVTAVFAGLLTKVGLYAIVRTQTLLFPGDGPSTTLLLFAGATIVVGTLGAVAQDDLRRLLSFTIVGHIGYQLLGLGLFSVAGFAGMVFYTVHHIVMQTTLFLVAGMIERTAGAGTLPRIGGLLRRSPLLALLFALPAASLAGLPPLSGFVAKLALIQAGMAQGRYVVVAAALLGGVLTIFAMARVWGGAFWGSPPPVDRDNAASARSPRLMTGSTGLLVAFGVALAVGAGPLYAVSSDAAAELIRPSAYVEAVLGR